MKSTTWKKYASDGTDDFPANIVVEVCEGKGEKVEFDKGYSKFFFSYDESINTRRKLNTSCEWVEEKMYEECKKQRC